MSPSAAWLWFLSLAGLTAVVWGSLWGAIPRAARFPLIFYFAVYILTTGIGATLIGLTDGSALIRVDMEAGWGLNVALLPGSVTPQYWIILFAPLIAPAALFVLFPASERRLSRSPQSPSPSDHVSAAAFATVLCVFAGYCLGKLFLQGYGMSIAMWFQSEGDFVAMMVHRMALATSLGSVFFGIAYITLPTLAQSAAYEFVRLRNSGWTFLLALSVGAMMFIDLSLMQKSHAMVHLLMIAVGLAELRFLRWKSVLLVFASLFVALTFLMSLMLDGWDSAQTLRLIIYRMSHAYPYYLTIFPDLENFTGIDMGLHLIGMGAPSDETWRVFTYMYPGYYEIEGACPAPAHVDAYAQGGLAYALIISLAIGALIRWSAHLRMTVRGPIGFALYMQSLMALYYVSQTSFRETVISCYGIFYAFVAIIPLYALRSSANDSRGRAGPLDVAPAGARRAVGPVA